MPRWLWLLLPLALLGGFWLYRKSHKTPISLPEPGQLEQTQIRQEPGGLRFKLKGPFKVTLYTPAGPFTQSGSNEIFMPYHRAGLLDYRLEAGERVLEGSLQRPPTDPITPLTPKVGARATRVDGSTQPAVVIHPLDPQANVSSDPVAVSAYYPDNSTWNRTLPIQHQLAWSYFPSGNKTGLVKVVVKVAEARTERQEVDVQPGRTRLGQVEVVEGSSGAGSRDRFSVNLKTLRDQRGNQAQDGMAVGVWGRGSTSDFFATQPTVEGQVSLRLLPPDTQEKLSLSARSEDWQSSVFNLESGPNLQIRSLPAQWQGRTLVVGPIEDQRGALPDTGTTLKLQIFAKGGSLLLEQAVALKAGVARWEAPALPQDSRVRVEVGGQHKELVVP